MMKQLKDIQNKLEWEECYNPDFNWDNLCFYASNELPEYLIITFQDKINWYYISKYQKLSEKFILKFLSKIDLNTLILFNPTYINHVAFSNNSSTKSSFSTKFLYELRHNINWQIISSECILTEAQIKKFKKYVDWKNISQFQNLSEDFIREFQDKVNWNNIFAFQNLSENFKKEFKHKIKHEAI